MTKELNECIEEARERILALEDDWDGEGERAFTKEEFEFAETVIRLVHVGMLVNHDITMIVPWIDPFMKGTIDIEWKTDVYHLLVSVNHDEKSIAYYGDDHDSGGTTKIKGDITIGTIATFQQDIKKLLDVI